MLFLFILCVTCFSKFFILNNFIIICIICYFKFGVYSSKLNISVSPNVTYLLNPLRPQWDIRPQQSSATRSCPWLGPELLPTTAPSLSARPLLFVATSSPNVPATFPLVCKCAKYLVTKCGMYVAILGVTPADGEVEGDCDVCHIRKRYMAEYT